MLQDRIKTNRKIYYAISFKNEEKYREGTLNYVTISHKEMAECFFITLCYNGIKEEIAKKYNKTPNDVEDFQIDRIEILK